MKILFCCHPIFQRQVDPDFESEFVAARQAGFEVLLFNFKDVEDEKYDKALRDIPVQVEKTEVILRSWMLKPASYHEFYQVLQEKNIFLINNPAAYLTCHYFPNSYEIIKSDTPFSVFFKWKEEAGFDYVMDALTVFENKAILVKDYVKSEKYYWHEACFIPDASDRKSVEKITKRFLELRGRFLNEGLVFREFVELEYLPESQSVQMPLAREFRLFFLKGKLLALLPYWDKTKYNGELPDIQHFTEIASRIKSIFFTMDVAKSKKGKWLIIELGDGQVSGIPETADLKDFYRKLN